MNRRWSFRTRLTVLIGAIFVLGGATLLIVQYVMVSELLMRGTAGTVTTIQEGVYRIDTIDGSVSFEEAAPLSGQSSQSGTVELQSEVGAAADMGDMFDEETAFAPVYPPYNLESMDVSLTEGYVAPTVGAISTMLRSEVNQISQEVLDGLLIGSIITLLGFTFVAVIAAQWLSRRSLGRIGEITAATREINREGLGRRLDLTGPKDEIKELGDTIDAMLERLEESFALQDRFISGASHELRTPLTTTRSALEIPLAQGLVPAEIEPDLRRALAANQRSERLIAAFLALARTSHDQEIVEDVDVTELVEDVLGSDKYVALAESREIVVDLDLQDDVHCSTERDLLAIAIRNIIDNAIRHNTAEGELSLHLFTTSVSVVLEVSNAGEVLSEEQIAQLKEPFNRGSKTRLAGDGIGLGLTLTESIAKRLDGQLWLQPRDGGGLQVRLTLPVGG